MRLVTLFAVVAVRFAGSLVAGILVGSSLVAGILVAAPARAATLAVPENIEPWGTSPELPADQRGIYVNLAEAMMTRTHIPIEIVFVPYGRMLQDVRSGSADYAFGVIGPATEQAGPFTATVGKVPMVAVARTGLALKTLTDLRGFTEVGYLRGGSCGAAVDGDAAIRRVAQDSYDAAIRKLAAGRLDAWCSVKAGYSYALRRLQMADRMGDEIEYGAVTIGFQVTPGKVGSAEAAELTGVVNSLVKDGVAGSIFTRYLGAPYQN